MVVYDDGFRAVNDADVRKAVERLGPLLDEGWVDVANAPPAVVADLVVVARYAPRWHDSPPGPGRYWIEPKPHEPFTFNGQMRDVPNVAPPLPEWWRRFRWYGPIPADHGALHKE